MPVGSCLSGGLTVVLSSIGFVLETLVNKLVHEISFL